MKDYIVKVKDLSNETIQSIRDVSRITWISDVRNYLIVEATDREIDIIKELPNVVHIEEDKCHDHEK